MKRYLIIILLSVIVFSATAEVVDKIVAKVGTDVILKSDLDRQIGQMRSTGVREELLIPRQVLNNMVENRVMIQKAKELKISVDETAIKNYADRYMGQIRAQYPDDAAFQADLRKMNTTQRELLKYVTEQITESALTEQLVEKHISSRVRVEEAEMIAFYEASKDSMAVKPVSWDLRMIMREIQPSKEVEAAILAEMRAIRQQLDNGADFAELAVQYSDCPSKEQGGDLGLFKRGMMVKPFEDAAFAMSVGEISGIVESQFGYHIIKVTEKQGDEVRASHILRTLSPSEADADREMALMNTLRERILAKESFASLAEEYSQDPETAAEGGLLGDFSERDFPELFAAPIMNTAVGAPTEVLKNEGMLYLFMRDTQRPGRLYTYDEVREQVQTFMMRQKQLDAYDDWIEKVKAESYISITL